jgi:hypothetical protein
MVKVVFCWFGCWMTLLDTVPLVLANAIFTNLSVHLIEFGLDFMVCDKSIVIAVQLLHELFDLLIRQVLDIRVHSVCAAQAQRKSSVYAMRGVL